MNSEMASVVPGDWLPESARRKLSGMRVRWVPPREARSYCAKAKRISPSKWSPKYRVVSDSSRPGQWRNDTNPYQVGIMDAIGTPGVERISVIKVPQIGATECVHNCVGWKVDTDPAPILYVYPDDAQCSKNSKKRIQPMFRDSKHLQRHLTGRDEDLTSKMLQLKPTTIYLASAQSPSQLANTPVCWVVFDEVDKYQDLVGSETSAIKLGEKRATTYPDDRKYIYLSSPTSERGQIWQQVKASQVCMHFWVRCPHCKEYQAMSFERIRWDGGGDADPNEIKGRNLAWYECPRCGAVWDEYDREQALAAGQWRADSGGQQMFEQLDERAKLSGMFGRELSEILQDYLPHNISFHVPSWISTFISMGSIAAAFIETLQKDDPSEKKAALRDFANGYEGTPWREWRNSRAEDSIVALQDEYDEGDVPEWADVLLLGADTQDNGFWYEIRAFQRGPMLRSHGVRRGFVDSLAALEEVALHTSYCKTSGVEVPLRAGLIDAMGHRTVEVYDWCRKVRIIKPLKGERKLDQLLAETRIEKIGGRAVPGGLILHRIDTNHFKDLLVAKLQTSVADPGAWTFSRGLDASHARHYVSEDVDPKTGYWACPQGKANHLWDCSVYVLALAYILRLRQYRKASPADQRGEDDHKLPIVRRRARYQITR